MSLEELNDILGVSIPDNLVDKVEKVQDPPHFNVYVPASNAYEVMKKLRNEADVYHLSTITGMEQKDEFNVIYHLQHRIEETEKEVPINFFVTKIDKKKPKSPSMIDFFVAADYYEREVYDFYGVFFDNHPYMERLILPEKWPDDVRPMRKDYSWEQLKEITMDIASKITED